MKKLLLAAVALLAALPAVAQAQTPLPVTQQVVISDHRKRFDTNPANPPVPAVVRYILIDPGNAVPSRDGFEPLERVAVLVLFIGGDGTLNLTRGLLSKSTPARRTSWRATAITSQLRDSSSSWPTRRTISMPALAGCAANACLTGRSGTSTWRTSTL